MSPNALELGLCNPGACASPKRDSLFGNRAERACHLLAAATGGKGKAATLLRGVRGYRHARWSLYLLCHGTIVWAEPEQLIVPTLPFDDGCSSILAVAAPPEVGRRMEARREAAGWARLVQVSQVTGTAANLRMSPAACPQSRSCCC
jgi:hypothetical protein